MSTRPSITFAVIVFLISASSSLKAAETIGESDKYLATNCDSPGKVIVTGKKSKRILFKLSGDDIYDEIGNVANAVFSEDGTFIAYSVGTASTGHAVRLFELDPAGKPKQLKFKSPPIDFSKADHVYIVPKRITRGKLLYELRVDKKVSNWSYDIKTAKHVAAATKGASAE